MSKPPGSEPIDKMSDFSSLSETTQQIRICRATQRSFDNLSVIIVRKQPSCRRLYSREIWTLNTPKTCSIICCLALSNIRHFFFRWETERSGPTEELQKYHKISRTTSRNTFQKTSLGSLSRLAMNRARQKYGIIAESTETRLRDLGAFDRKFPARFQRTTTFITHKVSYHLHGLLGIALSIHTALPPRYQKLGRIWRTKTA